MMSADQQFATLNREPFSSIEQQIAFRYAPHIRFDALEPFLPLAVGCTLFDHNGVSPSFPRNIVLEAGTQYIIEYAIWWDWDIQHLYELEHIWVHVGVDGEISKVEASAHGKCLPMDAAQMESGRVTLYSEPGKHSFAPSVDWLSNMAGVTNAACDGYAGDDGVLLNDMFRDSIGLVTAMNWRLVKRYLQQRAFKPEYRFTRLFDLRDVPLIPWESLHTWIPSRVRWWMTYLNDTQPHIAVVCLDSGDTLVDEASEIKNENGVTQRAELIPGADELVRHLKQEGYTLALVVDGPRGTFENTLGARGLFELFDAYAISGEIGVEKPDAKMFHTALDALNIAPEDYGRCIMVGNNLSRDIEGANQVGMISVWLDWSPRRAKVPAHDGQIPDYTIHTPLDLLALLEKVEHSLEPDV